MSRRVFISSVMRDFVLERQAAKEAIARLRHQPVMAEDFGAQPVSSQTACLEGVRQSDIYVGIYGERYGWVAPSSGLGATEEEYQEAKRLGLPLLCFEKDGPKDARQAEFLQRIKEYETGNAIAFFDSAEKLKMEIVQALNDVMGMPGVTTLGPANAAAALDQYRWGSQRSEQYGTWLGAALIPARQGETFIDVLDFGRQEIRDRFLQPALFGPGALFNIESGTSTAEENDALVFGQGEKRQPLTKLEIYPGGVLVYGTSLRRESTGFSMDQLYIIDEADVEARLTRFLAYADAHFKSLHRGEIISSLYLGASLTGIQNKTFGKLPAQSLSGFSIPTSGLPDPLKVPSAPLQISRADLADPSAIARKVKEHFARQFRNANAYYTPGTARR